MASCNLDTAAFYRQRQQGRLVERWKLDKKWLNPKIYKNLLYQC
jgi:hypothetical protein